MGSLGAFAIFGSLMSQLAVVERNGLKFRTQGTSNTYIRYIDLSVVRVTLGSFDAFVSK